MSPLIKAAACAKVYRLWQQNSTSLITLLEEVGAQKGITLDTMIETFNALYPNKLHPLFIVKQKK